MRANCFVCGEEKFVVHSHEVLVCWEPLCQAMMRHITSINDKTPEQIALMIVEFRKFRRFT